jgi:hypothetical protein
VEGHGIFVPGSIGLELLYEGSNIVVVEVQRMVELRGARSVNGCSCAIVATVATDLRCVAQSECRSVISKIGWHFLDKCGYAWA